MTTTITLKTHADKGGIDSPSALLDRIRNHDFTAHMSDSYAVTRRAERDMEEIKRAAEQFGMTDVLMWSNILRGKVFWGPCSRKF